MSMHAFLPGYKELSGWINDLRKESGFRLKSWPPFLAGLVLLFFAFVFMGSNFREAFNIALFLAPLWLSALVITAAWALWVILKRSEFIARQEYILLEIKPPRTLDKPPLAMEAVLAGLHHSPGEGSWYKRYILGNVRPYWSLEIASLEGQVHFFIWTRAGFRRIIEAAVYAQYPGAQVVEAPDYARMITAATQEWSIWGCDYEHTQKDPYPIKTYVEYGLDKVQKEPEQVDPLANLIEFMGSMGKGEYLWLQLVIRVHKGEKYEGKLNKAGKKYTWKDEAEEIVDAIRKATRTPYIDPTTGKEMPGFPNPSKGQSEQMAAIERNVAKLAFDVGARGVYLALPERFDPINITGLVGIFKQFSSESWNGFKPARWMTQFDDYPWERVQKLKDEVRTDLIDAYRRRQHFYQPYNLSHMTMSTEEIATLFHIPSASVSTPTLPRIQSATGEAPANLPT